MAERRDIDRERDRRPGLLHRIYQFRHLVYLLVLGGIVAWKMWPVFESRIEEVKGMAQSAQGRVLVAGSDAAPGLVFEAVAQFREQYPEVMVDASGGGTVSALEDLLNKRADVAVLSRAPSTYEQRVAVDRGDSLLYFPVALAGISFVAGEKSGLRSLDLAELRDLTRGGLEAVSVGGRRLRVYGPDPGSGLWEALKERVEIQEAIAPGYVPLADGQDVIAAVREDPASVGFASSITFELPSDDPELTAIRVALDSGDEFGPTRSNIVSGRYPLYHYVYFCTTASRGALAAGFVTYFSQPTGQKWVARRGFLPAKLPARQIHLTGSTSS